MLSCHHAAFPAAAEHPPRHSHQRVCQHHAQGGHRQPQQLAQLRALQRASGAAVLGSPCRRRRVRCCLFELLSHSRGRRGGGQAVGGRQVGVRFGRGWPQGSTACAVAGCWGCRAAERRCCVGTGIALAGGAACCRQVLPLRWGSSSCTQRRCRRRRRRRLAAAAALSGGSAAWPACRTRNCSRLDRLGRPGSTELSRAQACGVHGSATMQRSARSFSGLSMITICAAMGGIESTAERSTPATKTLAMGSAFRLGCFHCHCNRSLASSTARRDCEKASPHPSAAGSLFGAADQARGVFTCSWTAVEEGERTAPLASKPCHALRYLVGPTLHSSTAIHTEIAPPGFAAAGGGAGGAAAGAAARCASSAAVLAAGLTATFWPQCSLSTARSEPSHPNNVVLASSLVPVPQGSATNRHSPNAVPTSTPHLNPASHAELVSA